MTLLTALKKKVDAGKIKDRKINEALDHIRNNCKKRFVTGEINDNFKIEVSGNICCLSYYNPMHYTCCNCIVN